MKNRRILAALGVVLSMGMMMTGCAGTEDVPQVEVREMSMEETKQPQQKTDGEEDAEKPKQDDTETGQEGGQTVNAPQGAEYLGGKVQNLQEEGMILAQTTLTDEEGMVTLLEVKDARKITVKFTADTRVEHWTIQGGGAGIDMQEASFSDLEEGMGVEVEGYFEGEDFVALRVIIEEYV